MDPRHLQKQPKVEAVAFDGLTIRCCQQVGANFILRGIRYVNDFEYEKAIADMNRSLDNNIETVFLPASPIHLRSLDIGPRRPQERRRRHAIPPRRGRPLPCALTEKQKNKR